MKRLVIGLVFVLFALLFTACEPAEKAGNSAVKEAELSLSDQPMAQWRRDVLNLALSGVSAMPLNPHIKNRSRAQQNLSDVYLELDQPARAYSVAMQIENWQRWMALANLAFYLSENGETAQSRLIAAKVQTALDAADDLHSGRVVASTPNLLIDTLEDRRYQSVLARMAEVDLLNSTAESMDVDAEVYGEVNAFFLRMNMLPSGADHFEQNMEALRVVIEDPNFEIVHLGLLEMAELVGRHYESAKLNAMLELDVFPTLGKNIPVFVRIDVLRVFAEVAIQHNDVSSAEPLLEKINAMVEALKSSPRYYIPEATRLAQIRFDAGKPELARDQLEAMITVYQEKRELIVDMERADLLCHLAETSFYVGNLPAALTFYSQAVAEGQVNPNSRPQADDLNRICCSMALNGIEPTKELWIALKAMKSGLGDPW